MKAIEIDHMMSKRTPFIPNIKKKFHLFYKIRNKSEGNFEERQKEYLNKKNRHSAEIKNRIDSDFFIYHLFSNSFASFHNASISSNDISVKGRPARILCSSI